MLSQTWTDVQPPRRDKSRSRGQVLDRDASHRPSTRNATRVKRGGGGGGGGGRNYTFSSDLKKGGRNGGADVADVVTFIEWVIVILRQNTILLDIMQFCWHKILLVLVLSVSSILSALILLRSKLNLFRQHRFCRLAEFILSSWNEVYLYSIQSRKNSFWFNPYCWDVIHFVQIKCSYSISPPFLYAQSCYESCDRLTM